MSTTTTATPSTGPRTGRWFRAQGAQLPPARTRGRRSHTASSRARSMSALMGAPNRAPQDVMGNSDLTFVDWLFQ